MIKNFKKKKNNKGFTLVELLVVIAIIGILAVVAVPSLMKNIDKGKASDIVAEYSAIRAACIAKYSDDGVLPATEADLNGGTEGSEVYLDNIDTGKYTITSAAKTVTITAIGAHTGDVETKVNDAIGTAAEVDTTEAGDITIAFTIN